ncbi:signal peptidase I [Parvularcula oceani]|uniref:signal peptidase I n=1 Tax=Parvularcula oceani TaxID=1247963 RepID=UPI000A6F8727|nr:signal peptidase I [Parvularcula oceani]
MAETSRSVGMENETLSDEGSMTAAEEAWDIIKTVLIAVAVTLLLRFFLIQPFNIPSGSMKPTLLVGDFILVDKIDYGYSRASLIYPLTRMPIEGRLFGDTPERGEVVVFKNQNHGNRDYIKRVVGLPGDEIQVISGLLHINGEPVQREALDVPALCDGYAPAARVYRETMPDGGPSYVIQECQGDNYIYDNTPLIEVPEGHYFMMGDNRDNSLDSRTSTVRFVPYDQIVGRATRVAFSVDGSEARLWQIWKWPGAIRYGRITDRVE